MAQKKLKGTVESNDVQKGSIVIAGKTLVASPKTRAWVAQMREGDSVEVSYDDENNTIFYVEKESPVVSRIETKSNSPSVSFTDKDRIIVRQNALAHADAVLGKIMRPDNSGDETAYFNFAERCENWILR